MPPLAHLAWPFFGEEHRQFGPALADWANKEVGRHIDHANVDQSCRALVRALGDAGWLKAVVPKAYGGLTEKLDVRTIWAARAILSWHDSLADFAFAMQGLGTTSISLFGSDEIKAKYLPPVRDGRHIAAFALSEPEAGSDVSALATTATKDGPSHMRIDGLKTWISNGGIADHYVVFARTGEAPGAKGLSCFIVDPLTMRDEVRGSGTASTRPIFFIRSLLLAVVVAVPPRPPMPPRKNENGVMAFWLPLLEAVGSGNNCPSWSAISDASALTRRKTRSSVTSVTSWSISFTMFSMVANRSAGALTDRKSVA